MLVPGLALGLDLTISFSTVVLLQGLDLAVLLMEFRISMALFLDLDMLVLSGLVGIKWFLIWNWIQQVLSGLDGL